MLETRIITPFCMYFDTCLDTSKVPIRFIFSSLLKDSKG